MMSNNVEVGACRGEGDEGVVGEIVATEEQELGGAGDRVAYYF